MRCSGRRVVWTPAGHGMGTLGRTRTWVLRCAVVAWSPLAGESLPRGRASVTIAPSEGSAAYESAGEVALESAFAKIEDIDDCHILTVCLSSAKNVDCEKAKSISLEGSAFVLILGAR